MTTEYNEKSALSYEALWVTLAEEKHDAAEREALSYYAQNPQNDEIMLALLAARTRSGALVKIHEGKAPSKVSDDLPLFIKNTVLLERILLQATEPQKSLLYDYIRGLLEHTAFVKNTLSDSFIKENAKAIATFFAAIVPIVVTNEGKKNATMCKLAELLLRTEAYDEARSIYELALNTNMNAADCRLGILLCALGIHSEEEIATASAFDAQMPEYRALLDSLSHYKSKQRKYEALAAKNEKSKGTRADSAKKKKRSAERRLKKENFAAYFGWARLIFCLLATAFALCFHGGVLMKELVDAIPFVGGVGEYGIAYEVFSIFVFLGFWINLGPALGMTTNLPVLLCSLADKILKNEDYLRTPSYTARRRLVFVGMDLLGCLAVDSFGKQFFGHTVLPAGFEVVIGALTGVGALAFLYYIFHLTAVWCEKNSVCISTSLSKSDGVDNLLGGLFVAALCAYLFVKESESVSFARVDDIFLLIFAILGVVLMIYGVVKDISLYTGKAKWNGDLWITDEPMLLHLSLSSAIVIFAYRTLFYGEISTYWILIGVLLFAALLFLMPILLSGYAINLISMSSILFGTVFVCMLAGVQHAVIHSDFTALLQDISFLMPGLGGASAPEGAPVLISALGIFFYTTLAVLLLPGFVGFVWVRILAFPLRLLRIKLPMAEMDPIEFALPLPKKVFFVVILEVMMIGMRHLLGLINSLLEPIFVENPMLVSVLMCAIRIVITYAAAIVFFHLLRRMSVVGVTQYSREDDGRFWVLGYHLSNLSILCATVGVLSLLLPVAPSGAAVADQVVSYFLVGTSAFVFFIGMALRHAGAYCAADLDIIAVERGFGTVYAVLAIAIGVVGVVLGASPMIFVPLGAVILNSLLGWWISFGLIPCSWWD